MLVAAAPPLPPSLPWPVAAPPLPPNVTDCAESEYAAVQAAIQELHSYELPEILAFKVCKSEEKFLAWIGASLDKNAPFSDEEERELLDESNY